MTAPAGTPPPGAQNHCPEALSFKVSPSVQLSAASFERVTEAPASFEVVTDPSKIAAPVTASAPSFDVVTRPAANFNSTTAPSVILSEVTASDASFDVVTAPSCSSVSPTLTGSQVATPFTSEVSTFPAPGTPPEILT